LTSEHTEWVAQILSVTDGMKPEMTRADLMKFFQHLTDATESAFPLLIMNGVTGVRDMGEIWLKSIAGAPRLPAVCEWGLTLSALAPLSMALRKACRTGSKGAVPAGRH